MKHLCCALLLMFCGFIAMTQACTSQPMHPEVLYCRADYVIKIKVKSMKNVFLQQDGSIVDAVNVIRPEGGEESEKEEEPDEEEDPLITDELPEELFPPEPITSDRDFNGGDEDVGGVQDESEEDVSNEQPAEEEEAGPAPDGGRLINWHGIQTSHASSNRNNQDAASSIEVEVPTDKATDVNSPALVVNDGPATTDEASESTGVSRLAAAHRMKDAVVNFAAEIRSPYSASGPDGAMPGYPAHFSSIRGKPLGLRAPVGPPGIHTRHEDVLRSKRSSRRRKKSRKSRRRARLGNLESAGLLVPEGTPRGEITTHSGILMTQYSIVVLRIFKGEVSNRTEYLYTPPHNGLCRMILKRRHPYIVMGKSIDGRLHLTQSDYKIDLTQLSEAEQRHLTRNMRHRYSRGCSDCYIQICNGLCNDESDRNRCVWKNLYSLIDARASQFACVRKKNGVCGWYNALNQKMRPQDLDQ